MTLFRDIRFGCRLLLRHPTFAAAALAVMALGIAATTSVFTVVRGVLLQPLPYRQPDRLVLFRAELPGYAHQPLLTDEEAAAMRDRTDLFESTTGVYDSEGNLTSPDDMEAVAAASISDNFFETLGVPLALGRSVARTDVGRPFMTAVDISYELWQRQYSGDPRIVGRRIEVNNIPVTVVGVLPRGFRLDLGPGVAVARHVDVWYPRADDDMGTYRYRVVVARLRNGVARSSAQAAVDALMTRLVAARPASYRTGPARLTLAPLDEDVVSDVKPALVALAGAVAFVLLVACANLANLLLARASARSREIAIRSSIGASRGQIVRQLLAEGLVIGTLGAVAGLVIAQWGVDGLLALAPATLPSREAIAIDAPVAALAAALSIACALASSLVPGWHATRSDLIAAVKQDPSSGRSRTTRGVLVASQLALSLVLLVAAGLMMRAFIGLRSTPLGFDSNGAMTMNVHLQVQRFNSGPQEDQGARRLAFYRALAASTSQIPGVRQIGIGLHVPLDGDPIVQRFARGPNDPERQADGVVALAGYLETLRVPLAAGRYFAPADDQRFVVIVDEMLAADLWPGRSPVGEQMILSPSRRPQRVEVVGVVPHVQLRGPRTRGLPQIWMSYAANPYSDLNIVVRAANPMAFAGAVKQAVADLKPGRPVHDVRLLSDYVDDASADTRFALYVLGLFAVIAVVLTAIGVYGVVAYATARRAREIAVRLALGADRRQIVALVLREGAVWTVAGIAIGLACARLLTRLLSTLLFHVGPDDPVTFAGVAALLAAVALVASAIPAIRAVRIDPMLSLRSE
ncbi:MAG TPA: ADOP family duplicated permease [Vicinamibacterales bacterium]|nr:ADOP family duplicated permease [Vicinamibacterales bacterium]